MVKKQPHLDEEIFELIQEGLSDEEVSQILVSLKLNDEDPRKVYLELESPVPFKPIPESVRLGIKEFIYEAGLLDYLFSHPEPIIFGELCKKEYSFSNNGLIQDVMVGSQWDSWYGVVYLLIDTNLDGRLYHKMYYVGQTIQTLWKRFYNHLNFPSNKLLENAILRYGKKFEIIKIENDVYQTKDGEFIIIVLKKCLDLEELNETEKYFIKKYKSSILDYFSYNKKNEKEPLYGYNISRGGGGFPVVSGEFHHSFINVNKDLLRDLISQGFKAGEIASELEISVPTLIDKIKYFWSRKGINSLTEARIVFDGCEAYLNRVGKSGRSVVGVEIDKDLLITKIEKGAFLYELERFFDVSFSSITDVLNELGYKNITDCRKELGVMDIYLERKNILKDEATLRGKFHQGYKEIDPMELKEKIEENFSAEEIGNYFEVSRPTINSRIKEFWSFNNFKQAQIFFNIFPKINGFLGKSIIEDFTAITNEDIEQEYLIELIKLGYNKGDIASVYRFGRTGINNYIKEVLRMNFDFAKLHYYWKPMIISCIMNDFNYSQTRKILGIGTRFVYLERIWRDIYLEFGDNNHTYKFLKRYYNYYPKINLDLLERLNDNGLGYLKIDSFFWKKYAPDITSLDKYHSYIKRISNYFRINKTLLIQLLKNGTTSRKTDSEFLKYLIQAINTMEQIADILGFSVTKARKFFRNTLGMNYSSAIHEFIWKPELIRMVKKYNTISEAARSEGYDINTLRSRFSQIWKKELVNTNSIASLFKYLKQRYIV